MIASRQLIAVEYCKSTFAELIASQQLIAVEYSRSTFIELIAPQQLIELLNTAGQPSYSFYCRLSPSWPAIFRTVGMAISSCVFRVKSDKLAWLQFSTCRGRILGRNWDKSLESFLPCYSANKLSILCPETSTKSYVYEFGFCISATDI